MNSKFTPAQRAAETRKRNAALKATADAKQTPVEIPVVTEEPQNVTVTPEPVFSPPETPVEYIQPQEIKEEVQPNLKPYVWYRIPESCIQGRLDENYTSIGNEYGDKVDKMLKLGYKILSAYPTRTDGVMIMLVLPQYAA